MKRIGIYGGSFDPPHVGHLQAAQYACQALQLDMLLMIPCCCASHKTAPVLGADPTQRLEMLKLAVGEQETIQVCDLEIARGGVSYTADTVNSLRQQYPDAALFLLLGTDMFLSFQSWYQPERILQDATLAVLSRGSEDREALEHQQKELERMGGKLCYVNNPVTEISSTQLRRMLIFACADPFLHPQVLSYIRKNGLYGTNLSRKRLPMAELEKTVVALLKPDRVAHVLGCRDTAADMARRWGADETDAARAGLLHDITKALDGPLQLTLCSQYDIMLDAFSRENPKTLHALTGSLVAERIFGENPAVVSAIASHTTGKANMNTLEKIIYVADYMEPNRNFPRVDKLRHLAYTDLDGALKMGLEMTLTLLREQGKEISPGSQEALTWLNARG